jgi:hypothetical protein
MIEENRIKIPENRLTLTEWNIDNLIKETEIHTTAFEDTVHSQVAYPRKEQDELASLLLFFPETYKWLDYPVFFDEIFNSLVITDIATALDHSLPDS